MHHPLMTKVNAGLAVMKDNQSGQNLHQLISLLP